MGAQWSGKTSQGYDEKGRIQRPTTQRFGKKVPNPKIHQ